MDRATHNASDPAVRPGASISFYKDGPYLVRGDFEIVGQDGTRVDAGRRIVALCRCGKSRMRPFCDGTHGRVNFCAPGLAEGDSLPARPPAPQKARPVRGRRDVPLTDGASAMEGDLEAQLSQAVAWISLAHKTLAALLDGPIRADEYLTVRVAEPLVRSASALVETRRFQTPPAASPELTRDGIPGARLLVGKASDAVAGYGEDPVLSTVYGLLCDAKSELETGLHQGDER